jgi:hypothetical protein
MFCSASPYRMKETQIPTANIIIAGVDESIADDEDGAVGFPPFDSEASSEF